MKKPLLITYEYPPDFGGIGKYLEQEVAFLKGQVKIVKAQDYEMFFWPKWLPLVWGVYVYFTKPKPSPNPSLEGRGVYCDSIWVSHILPIGYIVLIYKKLFKIPYRVYLHGLDLVRPKKSKWKTFWVKKILNNADEIICNSNATSKLLEFYNIKINPSVVMKGLKVRYPSIQKVNPEDYKQIGLDLRKKYNLENKKILLTISRLVKRKGINLVISALPDVWKQIPDLVYIVVGDGEEMSNLKALAHNQQNIIFTGAISDKEKYAWLYACDCFILTPIDDPNDFEGYGIVYKEAQMFNKPVIGSRVGGVSEAVGDSMPSEALYSERRIGGGVLVEAGNIEEISKAIIIKFSPSPRGS